MFFTLIAHPSSVPHLGGRNPNFGYRELRGRSEGAGPFLRIAKRDPSRQERLSSVGRTDLGLFPSSLSSLAAVTRVPARPPGVLGLRRGLHQGLGPDTRT